MVAQSEDNLHLCPVQMHPCSDMAAAARPRSHILWYRSVVTSGGTAVAVYIHGSHAPFSLCLKCYVKKIMFVRNNELPAHR